MIIAVYFCPAPQDGGGESVAWIDSARPDTLFISSVVTAAGQVGPNTLATLQPPAHTWETVYVRPGWVARPGEWPARGEQ